MLFSYSRYTGLDTGFDAAEHGKDSDELVLNGYAPDKATILNYLADLKNTERYDQVKILTMDVVDYNVVNFSLTLLPKVIEE